MQRLAEARDSSGKAEDAGSIAAQSPYGENPDSLTSFTLDLQSKDAWCKQKSGSSA